MTRIKPGSHNYLSLISVDYHFIYDKKKLRFEFQSPTTNFSFCVIIYLVFLSSYTSFSYGFLSYYYFNLVRRSVMTLSSFNLFIRICKNQTIVLPNKFNINYYWMNYLQFNFSFCLLAVVSLNSNYVLC
jgi:hypothetical protein